MNNNDNNGGTGPPVDETHADAESHKSSSRLIKVYAIWVEIISK